MNDALAAQRASLDPIVFDAIAVVRADSDPTERGPSLPSDHPAWQRDVLSLSSRARAAIAALRPIVITVLSFWDHRLREIALGAGTLGVDASGCYRLR